MTYVASPATKNARPASAGQRVGPDGPRHRIPSAHPIWQAPEARCRFATSGEQCRWPSGENTKELGSAGAAAVLGGQLADCAHQQGPLQFVPPCQTQNPTKIRFGRPRSPGPRLRFVSPQGAATHANNAASARLRANPSFEARPNGIALGPRGALVHHPPRGPSTMPSVPPQLER
jgi:hypothetical protein